LICLNKFLQSVDQILSKMKTSLLSAILSLLVCAPVVNAQIVQEFKTTPKSVIGYIEYIPKDYYANNHQYPVMIFLHGLGQRGPNSTNFETLKSAYNNLVMYGPPMHVKNGTQFPFILISPNLKSNYGDWPGWYIMEVIEHVKTYLRIDPKRIYLTGSSLGGGGTWIGAQEYPDYFAAIAPVAGSTNSPSKACLIAASNLPVWAFHGDDDGVVAYSKSVNMVNAINNCNPPIKAILKTYHGFGHETYKPAYDTGHVYQSPNLYEWMLQWVNDHSNKIPTANAGPAQKLVLPSSSITITGSGTDPDGTIAQYNWVQIGGTAVTLTNANTNRLTVSGVTTTGKYTFRLVVKDSKGAVASDDMDLYVKTSANTAPVAKAGSDKTVNIPSNSITLIGSGTDADGLIVSYAWTKLSGGTATLSGASTSSLTASGLVAGTYAFRLTVKDDNGATHFDDVNVYVNYVPSANAGSDKTITLPTSSITLLGSGADSDGTISSYAWSKVSGGTATLSGTSAANVTVSNLLAGTYVFRLTVKDNRGATKYDDVTVTVNPAIGSNVAPTVSVGSDKLISLPTTSVTVTGTAADSDGSIASYSWVKLAGGSATLVGATTATLTASALTTGDYIFQLTVTDDDGASKSDDVKVTVNASPVVSAGADKLISLPTNAVTIYGSASDTDGTISSYSWTKVSGGTATLSGTTTRALSASGLAAGSYVFRLTATDNRGAARYDDVALTVNIPPVSNAGSNRIITLPTNSVSLVGSGSDQDGTIIAYEWIKTSGGVATISGGATNTLSVQGMVSGTYVFRLTVTDNTGSKRYDDVTVLVNVPPVSNAGADKTIILPTNATSIAGSANDPDGSVTYYSWYKIAGGPAYMSGTNSPTLNLSGLYAGTYTFRLTVKDNNGALTSDDVNVTVTSSASGSSFADVEVVSDPSENDDTFATNDSDSDFYETNCPSCKVTVYNERLERIYDDSWKKDADATVFSSRGFYFYRVYREGKLIRSGKVFKQ
jgi:predicted esterase